MNRRAQPEAPRTGWPPGLLQDDCRGLSQWLAAKPDARRLVRERCKEIQDMRQEQEMNPEQVQVGWLVETTGGPRFWPLGEHSTAVMYCEDDAEPVAIYCDKEDLEQHNKEQEKPHE